VTNDQHREALGNLLTALREAEVPDDQAVAWWVYAGRPNEDRVPNWRQQPDSPEVYSY